MFRDFKSEIKTFFIVALIAIVLTVGGVLVFKSMQSTSTVPPTLKPEETDITTWQTYRSDEFGFGLKYPKEWRMIGPNELPVLNDESGKRFMSILFADRAVLGISFCAAYPQDQRCEALKVGNTQFIIDWGLNGEAVAEIDINADVVMFITLHQKQKRDIFDQILSTFRFVK